MHIEFSKLDIIHDVRCLNLLAVSILSSSTLVSLQISDPLVGV
jgi:hypothetical protein